MRKARRTGIITGLPDAMAEAELLVTIEELPYMVLTNLLKKNKMKKDN